MSKPRSALAERLVRQLDLEPELRSALRAVSREQFLGVAMASHSEDDTALPIGYGQTTSQPTVIVKMLHLLLQSARARKKVMEVGSGCGYVSALLAQIYEEVYAVERIRQLAQLTRENLRNLGYNNVRVKHSDGSAGLKELGELDGIIVSAATSRLPEALFGQLGVGARLVLPLEVDLDMTRITVIEKDENGAVKRQEHDSVAFVPLLKGVEA